MMSSLRSFLAGLLLVAGATTAASETPTLHVLTSQDLSPLARGADESPPGFHHELITDVADRAGIELELEYLPWERAQKLAQHDPTLYLLAVTRTEEREPIYDWILPVLDVNQVFVTTGPRLDDLEAARGLGPVAARSIYHGRLIAEGFDDPIMADDANALRMLSMDRVAAVFTLRERAIFTWAELGLSSDDLVIGEPIERATLWLAASKGSDQAMARRLQAAFVELKTDGTYDALHSRYFGPSGGTWPGPEG